MGGKNLFNDPHCMGLSLHTLIALAVSPSNARYVDLNRDPNDPLHVLRPRGGPRRAPGMSADPTIEREGDGPRAARGTPRALAGLGSGPKDAWLLRSADATRSGGEEILAANAGTSRPAGEGAGRAAGRSASDSPAGVEDMLAGSAPRRPLQDPIGEVEERSAVRPNNGLGSAACGSPSA